jgi:mannose-6-phosphate isomerase-like protein (cupin superfamily)
MRLVSACALALLCAGPAFADPPQPEVHRVVTAIKPDGSSAVLVDSVLPLKAGASKNPGAVLWATEGAPADFSMTADRVIKPGLMPPRNGTSFRIVEFVPTTPEDEAKLDPNLMMKVAGAGAPAKGLPPKHPFMHRTRTVDYAIVLAGEIDMMLDDGVVHLKAGDVVVQQATDHAWINHGKEPCRIAFILVDAQEP